MNNFLNLEIIYISLAVLVIALIAVIFKRRGKKRANVTEKSLFIKEGFATKIKSLIAGQSDFAKILPQLEEILLTADVGVKATEILIKNLNTEKNIADQEKALEQIKAQITQILTPKTEFVIDTTKKPFVIYLVGVNGVGKTTTIGKLACQFKTSGHKVLLVAADTFRAAAVEQLRIWSERNDVNFIGGAPEADPSSVIVDGLRSAKAKGSDVVLVDTAGRLQTKSNLMNELKKMVRMSSKEIGRAPDEIFLVVDAITGQNGFSQAKIFFEAIPLTGVILTKYDATAKGGIIISIVQETGLPIRYLGLGEGLHDLKPFVASDFVKKLFS